MKRSTRNRAQYAETEESVSKKANTTETLTQAEDEIEFEPEEEADSAAASPKASMRRIKFVREPFGYKPRVVPPWASRVKSRYVESTEYYLPRLESDTVAGEDQEYVAGEISHEPPVIVATIKQDLDQRDPEVVPKEAEEVAGKRKKRKAPKKQPVEVEETQEAEPDRVETPLYAYAVVDGEVQDTIVVDGDEAEAPVRYDLYQQQIYSEDVTSTYLVGSELAKHNWDSNEDIQNFFVANPHLNYAPDVRELAAMSKTASPEMNCQLITGLAGMVSCLKKEVAALKSEMVGLREIISSKKDMGNTKRRFSTMNDVRHPWRIQAMPPLREVDLVTTARTIDYTRGAKRQLSNKDGITRFVKTCLELLIPQEFARSYTVRDRSHRKNGLKDIGDHAKEQVTGCVLDLLGLYDIDELDDEGRADRAFFTNLVSHAMRMAL